MVKIQAAIIYLEKAKNLEQMIARNNDCTSIQKQAIATKEQCELIAVSILGGK